MREGAPVGYVDKSLPDEAVRLVSGDRAKVYGHPADDFGRAALIWSGVLGHPVTAEQVALCMLGVKMARLHHTPDHRDSVVDAHGYLLAYWACIEAGR